METVVFRETAPGTSEVPEIAAGRAPGLPGPAQIPDVVLVSNHRAALRKKRDFIGLFIVKLKRTKSIL